MRNPLPKNQPLVIGQRIHTHLYGRGFGTVYAIHGEQAPQSVGTFGGGVICTGGRAHFDIVFDDGGTTTMLPESILRGVQWEIYDEIRDADFIEQALQFAAAERIREGEESILREQRREERRQAAIDANPHLRRADSSSSGAKLGAKNIRTELKAAFPGTKFRVRSDYNSINIGWDLGPTTAQVEAIVDKYQQGHFNGMEDIYENDMENVWPDLFGGASYVFANRHIPSEVFERIARDTCALQRIEWQDHNTRGLFGQNDTEYTSTHIHRLLEMTVFPPGEPIRGVRHATDEERRASNTVHFWAVVEFGEPIAQTVPVDEVLPPERADTPPVDEPAEEKIIDISAHVLAPPQERVNRALANLAAMR